MKTTGLIAMMLITLPAFAQAPPAAAARPRIGLALEGGGAKGLAHIGVLSWLEEHHIPVDYIAGTSMGGLVGGLYAMGMRPEEMRKLVESLDWSELRGGRDALPGPGVSPQGRSPGLSELDGGGPEEWGRALQRNEFRQPRFTGAGPAHPRPTPA